MEKIFVHNFYMRMNLVQHRVLCIWVLKDVCLFVSMLPSLFNLVCTHKFPYAIFTCLENTNVTRRLVHFISIYGFNACSVSISYMKNFLYALKVFIFLPYQLLFVAFCSFFPCSLTVVHRGRKQKSGGRQWKSSRADKQHCFP